MKSPTQAELDNYRRVIKQANDSCRKYEKLAKTNDHESYKAEHKAIMAEYFKVEKSMRRRGYIAVLNLG